MGGLEWAELKTALPDVSESTMRDALREAGFHVLPPWGGVEQHTFDELDRSLRAFSEVYSSDEPLRRSCRRAVIEAKNRARWISQNEKVEASKRALKAEMVEWMLVWLGDPSIFPAWSEIRKKRFELSVELPIRP